MINNKSANANTNIINSCFHTKCNIFYQTNPSCKEYNDLLIYTIVSTIAKEPEFFAEALPELAQAPLDEARKKRLAMQRLHRAIHAAADGDPHTLETVDTSPLSPQEQLAVHGLHNNIKKNPPHDLGENVIRIPRQSDAGIQNGRRQSHRRSA